MLLEMEKIKNTSKIEEEKINIHIKAKEELEKSKKELEEELENIKPENEMKKFKNMLYIVPILFALLSIILFMFVNKVFSLISTVITIISFVSILIKNLKQNNTYKKEYEEIRKTKRNIEQRKEFIDEEINIKEKLIKEVKEKLELDVKIKKDKLRLDYPDSKIDINEIEGRQNILEEQNYINNLKLKISQKELTLQNIIEKLEKLTEIEEKLRLNEERIKDLIEYDETINIAKEVLEQAYLEMKESITPKFTENLSNGIKNITCGKYKRVKVNEEGNLLLEAENREVCKSKQFKWRYNRRALFFT